MPHIFKHTDILKQQDGNWTICINGKDHKLVSSRSRRETALEKALEVVYHLMQLAEEHVVQARRPKPPGQGRKPREAVGNFKAESQPAGTDFNKWFAETWNASETGQEAYNRLGMTPNQASVKAYQLRKKGVQLKRFSGHEPGTE